MKRQNRPKRVMIIQGHPDAEGSHLCHALARAYEQGAKEAGHEVKYIDIATLDFTVIRTKQDWESGALANDIANVQTAIIWANHLVLVYPLWLGTMPALLKVFLEQVLRPGFAFEMSPDGKRWTKNLTDKSARIVVTMGMPAFVYRWYFRAHGLKNMRRNILGFCGIKPIRESLIGMVEGAESARINKWLAKMRTLGSKGV
ncbi:NAD(P)H-dependent oxidoreductase [Methylophaga sp. OBS4]|uniref:NAD(P)H-dependent oxidoreductase n=1 Tax=Methylophaga sp. OBS4 TaxID=2991935 RepID=UPI0022510B66|nr:NAD(P)H-dependent oxidoreductase [Methylophaga sp. OBS4]MCX4187688.1 NAD(P)H-dependent oxidoreductase [Methylophaga sp. OBS4]